jgi:hypothetical protein
MRRIHDFVVTDFWRIMVFDGFGADSFLRDKLLRRGRRSCGRVSIPCFWFGKAFESLESPDGVFAVTSAGGAEFIRDGGFFMMGALLYRKWIASIYSFGDRGLIIIHPLGSRCSVTSNYESTIPF